MSSSSDATCAMEGSCPTITTATASALARFLPVAWQKVLFVSFSTVIYTLLFLTVLYFWWANRQFHFRKREKDGSRLSQLATHQDVMEFRALQKKKEREMRDTDNSSDSSSLTSDGDPELEDWENLSDYETDDEEEDLSASKKDAAKQNMKFLSGFPPEKRQAVKDLTAVVSNMEVFSYLSSEAFVQCLEFLEYVDLKEGELLFQEDTHDGSLYAVVEGQVKCQFELTQSNYQLDEEDDDPTEPFISFTAGNGDVVTSLLSMLTGLVRQWQERNGDPKTPIVPAGISVRATGAAPTTKLVRVSPQCFLAMLDKFPHDVHRIAQTVIARMQRVILQTVVRCLGLHKEIVRRDSSNTTTTTMFQPEAWERLIAALQNYIPDAASPSGRDDVEADAATVAAAQVMGQHQNMDSEYMKTIITTIQGKSSIVSLAPDSTLIETGDSQDCLYLVLQGTLDVGMSTMGPTSTVDPKQSKRRKSVNLNQRRIIFPQSQSQAHPPKQQTKIRRRHSHTYKGSLLTNSSTTQSTKNTNRSNFSKIYQAVVGDTVGRLSCFTGDANILTVKNASQWEPVLLYKIPKDIYEKIVAEYPSALTACLGSILDRLGSPIVCLLDWNVEWMHVQAGEDVIHRGETCDAMYAVLNGRLRAALPSSNSNNRTNKINSSGASTGSSTVPPRQDVEVNTSFLSRTKKKIQDRRLARKQRNNPKVANAPPPPSRRRMNPTGDEAPGEEYGRGAILGEVEILTGADWALDVYASRHSELARVPVSVLNAIIRMCPRAGLHLARVVASQIQKKNARKNQPVNSPGGPPLHVLGDSPNKSVSSTNGTSPSGAIDSCNASKIVSSSNGASRPGAVDSRNILPSYGLNLATIAVVPLLEGDFDLDGFCRTLERTLHHGIAPTALMTKDFARKQLGEAVFRQRNAMHTLKLTRLCGDMEENSRLVVYQADSSYTWWTRLCIQQADCILLVVRAEQAPPQKNVEACLSWAFRALNANIQLVVLRNSTHTHEEDEELDALETMESSDALNDWSEQRYWIGGHHLVRMPFKKNEQDFKRLCRRVTGRSIGVVFGGGGARGLAHIGVIKALMEAGITVDFVGGTSQGAYIGALFASNPDDYEALVKSARLMADTMSNVWEKLRDLTLPLVSFFTGQRFNRGIQKALGRRRIQDLICNFFCVSVDLRNNAQVVHTKGVCWRYVRASMTLQSYLPPLAEDGTLLVDGGYMNVLPADVMKKDMRARTVIAVDVSEEVILDNYEYGSHLNGWWLLWNSWNPFVATVKIPSMGDINERLSWVNGDRQKKKVRQCIDLFLQPPVANYGVLEFDKFDEIVQIGYDHAKPRVESFVRKNPHLVS